MVSSDDLSPLVSRSVTQLPPVTGLTAAAQAAQQPYDDVGTGGFDEEDSVAGESIADSQSDSECGLIRVNFDTERARQYQDQQAQRREGGACSSAESRWRGTASGLGARRRSREHPLEPRERAGLTQPDQSSESPKIQESRNPGIPG